MLVISRKPGEAFVIGSDVIVKILKIEGSEVKIGISAPQHVKIYRWEIYEKVLQENKLASQTSPENVKDLREVIK
ncbi:carbon storage regulator, CsrA [Pseudothermotoga thermarum DSM 5069]|uniref:Translational regulator CsrA n=1 Tax=Pseudothermotoga thermarum DSM 5069 TaxID=688269 RepID=F7YYV4_9THEM|nr:carbon storage regulator CsrA [Pseudothermotoga thermarum]AEH51147.1 carbon storage regulator, CsrA [Pseudothermotoga thermarum DSM 5069]